MIKKSLIIVILILISSCKEVKVTQTGGESDIEELKYIGSRMNILEERVTSLESKLEKTKSAITIEDDKKGN